jgi:DNA-binding transcriptional LysR family regulator
MSIDIHLLQVVQALARHGTVTAAAAGLGLTQSTVSHALSRLRAHYGDPLFVPSGKQLSRTPLAMKLVQEADGLLLDFERVQSLTESFDPSQSRRTFRIHMIDVAELLVLPGLLQRIGDSSLGVRIEVVRAPGSEVWAELEAGRLDLVIGTPWKAQPSLYRQRLLDEQYVGIARASHPLRKQLETVSGYLRSAHCVVTPRGPALGRIEAALAALSPSRRVLLQVPDFLCVPALVAQSDLVAAIPSTLLALHPDAQRLHLFKLPIAQTRFTVVQHWHKRVHDDPASKWLRGVIREAVPEELPGRKSR